jgi:branched-chain amino acid transport system permease protein
MNAEFFTISLLNGVSYGLLLFMLSSGLTLIFSMMGVLNFAHTSFYMLGAYFAYTLWGHCLNATACGASTNSVTCRSCW